MEQNAGLTKMDFNTTDGVHIIGLEAFTGDDNYNETDCLMIVADKEKLVTVKKMGENKLEFRVRGEPGVRVLIKEESTDTFHSLTICHHKGGIYISAEKLSNVPKEQAH